MKCWCGSMAEQLICNQQVVGSTPITSSIFLGDFPSGQRGQTVNLLSLTSVVRIHHPPPEKSTFYKVLFSRTFNFACVSFFINPFFIVSNKRPTLWVGLLFSLSKYNFHYFLKILVIFLLIMHIFLLIFVLKYDIM